MVFRTIRGKMLIGFGAVLSAILLTLGAFFFVAVRDTVVPLTKDLSQDVLRARSSSLGHLFLGYQTDIGTLSRESILRSGDSSAIEQELKRQIAGANKDYEMVFFADRQGAYVSSIGSYGNVADRPYFREIMSGARDQVISEPLVSRATGATVFVIASAVKDKDGRVVGLVAATVLLDTLTEIAGAVSVAENGFGWVMDHKGLLISHPSPNVRMKLNLLESSRNGYSGLEPIAAALKQGKSGFGEYRRPDGEVFATIYTPIPNTPNWGLGVSMPKAQMMAKADRLMRLVVIGIALVLTATILVVIIVSARISAPIRALVQSTEAVSRGNLDATIDIRTGDEIETLAQAFRRMMAELKTYIANLQKVTSEKERVESELHVANRIQASMLPRIFPPFPDIREIDLFATMQPAREVGGDFFDFFVLEDGRLCFCVGDVSGKGVPAALFMVIVMTILRNQAMHDADLARIFSQTNRMLCADNDEMMFVTVFMGILDPRTGGLEYVSAGHNPPALARQDGDFAFLRSAPSLAMGVIEDIDFEAHSTQLAPGDTLFVYSDGVTEAMDVRGELMGEPRTLDALNALKFRPVREMVDGMDARIKAFANGAPPSDDITMLAVEMVR